MHSFFRAYNGRSEQKRTEAAVEHIAAALEEIKRRRQQTERTEEYKALNMYYMQGYTYEQIERN